MPADARPSRAGFALVAVLAVTALLSGLLLSLSLWSRNSVEGAAVAASGVRADALLGSAVTVAAYQLFVLRLPPAQVSGQRLALDAGTATVLVDDDSGKVDLNGASPALLAAAYRAAGLAGMPPDTFAARVADWRDANDDASKGGAEAPAYRAANVPLPRNGPFRSVSDLRWVLGIGDADIAPLAPLVTVFNPRGGVNPYAAPQALIRNLPGMTPKVLAEVVAITAAPRDKASDTALSATLTEQEGFVDLTPPAILRLSIEATSRGASRSDRLTVRISAAQATPEAYSVLDWAE